MSTAPADTRLKSPSWNRRFPTDPHNGAGPLARRCSAQPRNSLLLRRLPVTDKARIAGISQSLNRLWAIRYMAEISVTTYDLLRNGSHPTPGGHTVFGAIPCVDTPPQINLGGPDRREAGGRPERFEAKGGASGSVPSRWFCPTGPGGTLELPCSVRRCLRRLAGGIWRDERTWAAGGARMEEQRPVTGRPGVDHAIVGSHTDVKRPSLSLMAVHTAHWSSEHRRWSSTHRRTR